MVYACDLKIFVKKALGDKAMQSTLPQIIELLPLDPESSSMDAVILDTRDVSNKKFKDALQKAIDHKHPNVLVIYIYQNEKEANLINCEYKSLQKRINAGVITEVYKEFLNGAIKSGDFTFQSSNTEVAASDNPITPPKPVVPAPAPAPVQEAPAEIPDLEPVPEPTPETTPPITGGLEEDIKRANTVGDMALFQSAVNRDAIVQELLKENSQYVGAVNMLDAIELQIKTIFADSKINAEEKFNSLYQLASQRANYRALTNDILVSKVVNILVTVTQKIESIYNARIQDTQTQIFSMRQAKNKIVEAPDTHFIEKLGEMQAECTVMLSQLYNVVDSVATLKKDVTLDVYDDRPCTNDFINNTAYSGTSTSFVPENTEEIILKLMQALSNGEITYSAIEQKVKGLLSTTFELANLFKEGIDKLISWNTLLSVNNVEEVVVKETALKWALRIFVGASDTGTTATTLIASALYARKGNTLLIDLSGHCDYERYGEELTSFDEFMREQTQKPMCVVSAYLNDDSEKIQQLVFRLREAVSYYRYINIVLDPSQVSTLKQLERDAISVGYITNCSPASLAFIRKAFSENDYTNIGRKIYMIDPPEQMNKILNKIGADLMSTKCIYIPYSRDVRACAVSGMRPYDLSDVRSLYEDVIR